MRDNVDLVECDDEPLTWCSDCEGEALILIDLGTSLELSCGHMLLGEELDKDDFSPEAVREGTLTHIMFCRACGERTAVRIELHPETREASMSLVCGHDPRSLF